MYACDHGRLSILIDSLYPPLLNDVLSSSFFCQYSIFLRANHRSVFSLLYFSISLASTIFSISVSKVDFCLLISSLNSSQYCLHNPQFVQSKSTDKCSVRFDSFLRLLRHMVKNLLSAHAFIFPRKVTCLVFLCLLAINYSLNLHQERQSRAYRM